ncbi:MAG TPA: OmpA family protein [Bacteroidales bacterium]|nr:OmpA family protein [Bacteroidales bacterium]
MKKTILFIFGIMLSNLIMAQAPKTPLTPLQKADSAFKYKDYHNSILLYQKALKKSKETGYINFQIGESYKNANNFTEAKKWYDKSSSIGYTNALLNLRLGEMLILSGDYNTAKTYIEKYMAEVPTDPIAKIRLESCNLGIKGQNEKPLLQVHNVKELNTVYSDYGVGYLNNKVIFSSTRSATGVELKIDPNTSQGFSDMYESTYEADKLQYTSPKKLEGSVNTTFNEGSFSFDSKNKYGYYSQCNGTEGKSRQCNIMYARYNETSNSWESSKLISFNSQTYRIQQPSISSDGKTLYFSSDMPGGFGGADLYKITKLSDTLWGQPENLGSEINTIGNEGFPFISGDTLLVFASDGLPGLGGLDVFTSKLKSGKFSKPVNVLNPINSSADDFNMIFKDSKDEGLFSSNRLGGVGDDDLYSYDLVPVILTVIGNVKDIKSKKNLENAIIYFKGNDGSLDSATTNSDGNYVFDKLKSKVTYNIKATKQGFLNDSKNISIGEEKYSKIFDASMGLDVNFELIKISKEEVKINNILYDYDKWFLREESKKELNHLIHVLKETPNVKVQLSSHTDERGAVKYNEELSQKRAQSVVDYLISSGIDSSRLIAKGYGFSNPLIKNAKTEDEHQMNRRTTFKILTEDNKVFLKETYEIDPVTKKQIKTETEIDIQTDSETTSSNNYHIISGSYATQNEAKNAVALLSKAGYAKASIVDQAANGNWRVAYQSFTSKDDAQNALNAIKKINSGAWLYEKK